jgi:hypothetical protein
MTSMPEHMDNSSNQEASSFPIKDQQVEEMYRQHLNFLLGDNAADRPIPELRVGLSQVLARGGDPFLVADLHAHLDRRQADDLSDPIPQVEEKPLPSTAKSDPIPGPGCGKSITPTPEPGRSPPILFQVRLGHQEAELALRDLHPTPTPDTQERESDQADS